MKTYFRWSLGFLTILLAGTGLFGVLQGCSGKSPASPELAIPSPPVLASNVLDDFEDGNISMSVNLVGAIQAPATQYGPAVSDPNDPSSPAVQQSVATGLVPLGVWIASSWGPNNKVNNPYVYQDGLGANGSNGYIWLHGTVTEPLGTPLYVAFQLEGKLRNGYPYDALTPNFTGVRFYYKIGSADTCSYRRFGIAIEQTLPKEEGGSCESDCYAHYGVVTTHSAIPATPGNIIPPDTWTLCSYNFAGLTQAYHLIPGTLMDYRTNFVKLVWQHGRNGMAGTSTVDYAVDQVEFF